MKNKKQDLVNGDGWNDAYITIQQNGVNVDICMKTLMNL